MEIFDIQTIAFCLWGYALSWLELLAVFTGIIAVYLASKGNVINFYIGLVNNVLYFALFYQYQLYSMMLLQVVYFVISSYGIYSWSQGNEANEKLKITELTTHQRLLLVGLIFIVGVIWGAVVRYFSGLFPDHVVEARYPFVDALLTIASIVGQLLLTRKKLENWLLWILVNVGSVMLYLSVGMYFTTLLYVLYLVIAIQAYWSWKKQMKSV